jgi:hypothetical protein
MSDKKTFEAATQAEADRQADEWWASQQGIRLIHRTKVAVGKEGPEMAKADRWAVTIHYEPKNSN